MRMLVRQRSDILADVASVSNPAFVHVDEKQWNANDTNPHKPYIHIHESQMPTYYGTKNHGTLMNRELSQPTWTMSAMA